MRRSGTPRFSPSVGLVLLALGCGGPSADPQPTGGGQGGTAGSGGTGGEGGQGGQGGSGAGPGSECGAGEIVKAAVPGSLLLRGTLVLPGSILVGELLIESDTITCVAASCADEIGAADASVVETNGIIFPGLIDTHNHVLFNVFDEDDWTPDKAYTHANQWSSTDARYAAVRSAKRYLNGEVDPAVNLNCELNKYGEMKGLVAGTTSIVGASNPVNRACYGSLARTVDQTPNDLGADKIEVATIFPSALAGNGVCNNFALGTTDAWLVHLAEGFDETARSQFGKLGEVTSTAGCLYEAKTAVVHGMALGAVELDLMADKGMGLVWSPRSNVSLYGLGKDLTKTTNIPLALARGINVSLAPDWSIGGSQNLLDELRFAKLVSDTHWNGQLTAEMLVEMVTTNAAKNLGLEGVIGSLVVGARADVMVVGGNPDKPYDSLLFARPRDVRLVLVNGVALYGDMGLEPLSPMALAPGCEALDVCTCPKFACVAEAGATETNKIDQTWAEIKGLLEAELDKYDALDLSEWDFAPISPLVRCE